MSALQYVRAALASFDDDPAATDYQRGYQEALRDVLHEAFGPLDRAAPGLLAALEAAIDAGIIPKSSALDGGAMRHSRQVHVADMCRAAIAKATGGAA